ncbi:TrbG/VirB9 family P-type conjugative transfer protein [Herbaspirillum autotrophicum]|uniref:TrbG/VirB9 family P-type conjugative transfer protein n=1 Tax=Herbaspirillum autotrophicum TaxID=180195 RepID=UPI0018DE675C|nr:TrbG/VirB9 family P-type conjugative transfer protein [Herbaspirillum autotrophicum]
MIFAGILLGNACAQHTMAAGSTATAVRVGSPAIIASSIDGKGISPYAMPLDNKLVVFPYDPNYVYPVLGRSQLFTRIALSPSEKVVGFYLSDQIRWISHVAKSRESVFVMPLQDGLTNTATLVTTLRTYDLSLKSVPASHNWYQRVSWHIPQSAFEEEIEPAGVLSAASDGAPDHLPAASKDSVDAQRVSEALTLLDVKQLNFNYSIEGDAPFKPSMVFDDGRTTWVKLPEDADAPVFFALSRSGEAEPVKPYPRDGYMVVQRPLPHGLLLKINKDEVRIKNRERNCGFFSRDCWKKNGASNIRTSD